MNKLFTLVFVLLGASGIARAQPYSVKWSTIDGGGGAGAGGQFAVRGTIGQPDAGAMGGGGFKVSGGFWSGLNVQQLSGAPILKIKILPGGLAVISWPIGAVGFSLEERVNLSSGDSWNATPVSTVDTATEHTITVPSAGVMKCYRLKK